jgi:hypothetical protein
MFFQACAKRIIVSVINTPSNTAHIHTLELGLDTHAVYKCSEPYYVLQVLFKNWMPFRSFVVYWKTLSAVVFGYYTTVCAGTNQTFFAFVKKQKGMPQFYCH